MIAFDGSNDCKLAKGLASRKQVLVGGGRSRGFDAQGGRFFEVPFSVVRVSKLEYRPRPTIRNDVIDNSEDCFSALFRRARPLKCMRPVEVPNILELRCDREIYNDLAYLFEIIHTPR